MLLNMGLNARKSVFGVYEQQRCRPAYADAQSDQRLCYSLLKSFISIFATSKISILYLVSVTEQAVLSMTLLKNPEDRFSRYKAHM